MKEEKIKKEAKEIMDNFMKALNKVEVEEEFNLSREDNKRNEKTKENRKKLDENFKQRFLSNAPKINGDAIVTSKGSWVE